MSTFMLIVLFVNARIVLGRSASHVIFNPEEGKADEEFNDLFVVVALIGMAGCCCCFVIRLLFCYIRLLFCYISNISKSNVVKLPNLSSVV